MIFFSDVNGGDVTIKEEPEDEEPSQKLGIHERNINYFFNFKYKHTLSISLLIWELNQHRFQLEYNKLHIM